MSELEVRIVKLEPMIVVSAYGFGKEPEGIAWDKISAYAKSKGILNDPEKFKTFGFDNPSPSPGSPNYGYEIWLPVDVGVEPEGDLRVLQFGGGLYAVTQFKGLENIGQVWKQLVMWRKDSKYKVAHHRCLENLLTPPDVPMEEYVFDLYLSIAE